ncbi:MAG: hypothetical protein JW833_02295 [Prolixibacteraceae bacterium]|nr:hypothetical protein [Prolixibacteraceae bacterium]
MKFKLILLIFLSIILFDCSDNFQKPTWTHFYIDTELPDKEWRNGGSGVADFDGDGNPEIVSKKWIQTDIPIISAFRGTN